MRHAAGPWRWRAARRTACQPAARRIARRGAAAALLLAAVGAAAQARPCPPWPAWQAFERRFVSADGRVVDDATERAHTTSEGQAYALFFALVANDRAAFARLLRWTRDNLAAGDLAARLPAWQWGRRDDGTWAVVDANSAADADLWLAYTLAEAGRLWRQSDYRTLAAQLAARVLREETAEVPSLGLVLLPGATGFGPWPQAQGVRVRLNPSYLPLPLLRRLAATQGDPAWERLLPTSLRLLTEAAPAGWAADWVSAEGAEHQLEWQFGDTPAQRRGAYDAIRVYLWLGLTSPREPALAPLLRHYQPVLRHVEQTGQVPLQVDAGTGEAEGVAGPGMTAAVAPLLARQGRADLAARLATPGIRQAAGAGHYYDQALGLFAFGHLDQRFRFEADGSLTPGWIACKAAPPPSPSSR